MSMIGDDFAWTRGRTLLSNPAWPTSVAIVYFSAVIICKRFITRPIDIPNVFVAAHNLALCIGSLIMFIGCLSAVLQICLKEASPEFAFCTPIGTKPQGEIWFWSYVYYLSKYYELLDTAVLVLKQKPTSFLHVFHHALVLIMSWLWVDQVQSLQFIGLLTNTAVHVVMYYYFCLAALKISPWWKKYITTFQIIQFVTSFCTLPAFFLYHLRLRRDEGGCAGTAALIFNAGFNFILLLLFIQFYRTSYKGSSRSRKKES